MRKKIEFLSSTFTSIQSLITLADSKANTSMTLQTFFLGIIMGSSVISGIFEILNKFPNRTLVYTYYLLFVLFIACSVIGIIYCLLVLKARFPVEKDEIDREGILYYSHITKHNNSTSFLTKINELNEEGWLNELTKQVYSIAHIVSTKMKYINTTIVFLFINLFFSIIITALSIYFIINKG